MTMNFVQSMTVN